MYDVMVRLDNLPEIPPGGFNFSFFPSPPREGVGILLRDRARGHAFETTTNILNKRGGFDCCFASHYCCSHTFSGKKSKVVPPSLVSHSWLLLGISISGPLAEIQARR